MSISSRSAADVACKILATSVLVFLLFVAGCGTSNTVTIAPPAKLAFTVQPTNVAAGSSVTPAVVVSVEDAQGNVVTTATNQITMAIGTNPSSGTLGGTAQVTAVNGVATFSNLSINNAGTGYTLTASATGLTSATSSAFNVVGAATKLAFTVQPSNVAAGASITAAVAVSVEDALGNVVTTGAAATSQITIAIGTNPSSGTLSGTAQANAVAGVATFSTLSINKVGTGYTLTATATGLTAATGSAFNVTAGVATKLAFTGQTSSTTAGAAITPAVIVSIEDAQGNVVLTATNQITIAIATNPSSGTLSGTRQVNAVAGVATFSNLSINNAGTGYTLMASATGLTSMISSAFNVTVGLPAKLAFTVQPSTVAASSSITPAVTVSIEDALGNLVVAATNQITIAIGTNPSGGTLSGTTQVNASAGVAAFSTLSINNAGTGYTLTASATALTSATSSAFNVFGAATQLIFTVQPSNVAAGSSITPAITVSVEDAQGAVVLTATNQITIAIGANPSTGTLSGTAQVNAVAGVATFSTLSINNVGTGYTVTASASGFTTVTSNAFNVTAVIVDPCATIGTGSESFLNGQYVWLTQGFDNGTTPEPALVGGVLTFNGTGSINSGGTIDSNLNSTHGVSSLAVTGGTYKVGSDHRACLAIATSQGTQHYRVSLGNISAGVAQVGHMINVDAAGPFTTGTLRKQSGTIPTTLSGAFAFEASSTQNTANCNNSVCGGKFAVAGVTTFSSNGSATGEIDFSQNGQLDASNTLTAWPASAGGGFTGGSYTINSTTGRGTLTFTPNGSSNAVHMQVYVVSATDLLLMDIDDQTQNSLFAGEALQQSGSFTQSSLNGPSILYDSSFSSGNPATTGAMIARITIPSSGTLNIFGYSAGGGTTQCEPQASPCTASTTPASATYVVDATGRVTLTGAGNHAPIFYMVSANKAFFLGSSGGVEAGRIEPQSSTSAPTGAAFAFGSIELGDSSADDSEGFATFTSGSVSGTTDNNSRGTLNLDQTFGVPTALNVSVDSTGLGLISGNNLACTIPLNGAIVASPCQLIFYVISPTRVVLIDITNGQGQANQNPSLQVADQ